MLGIAFPDDGVALDDSLCVFLEHLWEEGLPKSWASSTLSGLGRLCPRLKKLGFPLAWAFYTTWNKHELAERAPPFSAEIVMAMAGYCISVLKEPGLGFALLLSFHCILRIDECLGLTQGNLDWSAAGVLLHLGYTKGGKRRNEKEFVLSTDAFVNDLLKLMCEGKRPGDRLFNYDYQAFRNKLKAILNFFGLASFGFKSHSLRRGGATYEFRCNNSYDGVCHRGRWASVKTCRIYLADAIVMLNDVQFSAKTLRLLSEFGSRWDVLRI
jgi:hypothetical protein